MYELVSFIIYASLGHQSCLKMSDEILSVVKEYPWQCSSCKTCETCSVRRPKVKVNCNLSYKSIHKKNTIFSSKP